MVKFAKNIAQKSVLILYQVTEKRVLMLYQLCRNSKSFMSKKSENYLKKLVWVFITNDHIFKEWEEKILKLLICFVLLAYVPFKYFDKPMFKDISNIEYIEEKDCNNSKMIFKQIDNNREKEIFTIEKRETKSSEYEFFFEYDKEIELKNEDVNMIKNLFNQAKILKKWHELYLKNYISQILTIVQNSNNLSKYFLGDTFLKVSEQHYYKDDILNVGEFFRDFIKSKDKNFCSTQMIWKWVLFAFLPCLNSTPVDDSSQLNQEFINNNDLASIVREALQPIRDFPNVIQNWLEGIKNGSMDATLSKVEELTDAMKNCIEQNLGENGTMNQTFTKFAELADSMKVCFVEIQKDMHNVLGSKPYDQTLKEVASGSIEKTNFFNYAKKVDDFWSFFESCRMKFGVNLLFLKSFGQLGLSCDFNPLANERMFIVFSVGGMIDKDIVPILKNIHLRSINVNISYELKHGGSFYGVQVLTFPNVSIIPFIKSRNFCIGLRFLSNKIMISFGWLPTLYEV